MPLTSTIHDCTVIDCPDVGCTAVVCIAVVGCIQASCIDAICIATRFGMSLFVAIIASDEPARRSFVASRIAVFHDEPIFQ